METEKEELRTLVENGLKEKIATFGVPVLINTPACDIFQTEHNSCKGCPTELGCAKFTNAKLIALMAATIEPRTLNDLLNIQKEVLAKLDLVMNATSVQELKDIM